ncbi:unnamed protein product [Hermetia illucens]|uniref:Nardilysin n=2 Tax=Hermetia illucens TaxID=343691 RepID=A0A7R8UUN2_HERIL|nr:unnamed protein product [Hermetia illucens]
MKESLVQYLETPDKSENDKKEYRMLKLPNGLTAMLVSDPSPVPDDGSSIPSMCSTDSEDETSSDEEECESTETESETSSDDYESEEGDEKLAACALMVSVGSFSDPPDVQGLAHFLEHMIFMGSTKYPSENAFDSYIKKCGGFDNADTDCEETSFYFEIAEKYLDGAMDRFAQLFTEPLMKKDAMAREREAIESEFQSKMQDDDIRRDQLLANLGQTGHPCNEFSWGNLKTLKENISDDDLYVKVHEFRKRHYSAHRMYLCVQARLPLDTLEELVIKNFSDIPNNGLPGDDYSAFTHKNAFKDEFYQKVYFVKPVTNICKLEITWCLPPLVEKYRSKPHEYIAYLFGYEGQGSLCAYLRNKLWALELIAGIDDTGFEFNSIYSLFSVYIYLTEEGFQHLEDVLSATFSYVKLLQKSGASQTLFAELQAIEETTFRYQTDQSAFDNVQDLVLNMKYYDPKHVLSGSELYFEYDKNAIQNVLDHISTNNFNVMITSTMKYNGIEYDQKETWFGTEFTSIQMPVAWKDLWDNATIIPELTLPNPNVFIAKDFTISWNESLGPLPPYPSKVVDTDVCEMWFRQDDKFLLPISYMYFYFISPLPMESPKNAVLLALYSMLLKYQLVEELYPATIAGLSYQCYSSEKGLVLKASGYSEKLHLIVEIITKRMASFLENTTNKQLEVFIKQQERNFYNYFVKPKSLNKDIRLGIIENKRWSSFEKYNLLHEVTLDEVRDFAKNLVNELKIQAIIQGNLTEKHAHDVINSVLQNINCSKIKDLKSIESRTSCLPIGAHFVKCKSFSQTDSNTVITNFYQIGPCTVRIECILDLLMMFVEEPLFDILRTKEQLGYDVSASVRNNNGILGYSITVNSQENKHSADHVEERIEAFRTEMMNILQNTSDEDFQQVLSSLIKIKLVADNELKDEVSRNWGEITCEEYIFDRHKREVECLKTFTKDTILEFCTKNEAENFRKLSVQVIGRKSTEPEECPAPTEHRRRFALEYEDDPKAISSVESFKHTLTLYPVTKTTLDENK